MAVTFSPALLGNELFLQDVLVPPCAKVLIPFAAHLDHFLSEWGWKTLPHWLPLMHGTWQAVVKLMLRFPDRIHDAKFFFEYVGSAMPYFDPQFVRTRLLESQNYFAIDELAVRSVAVSHMAKLLSSCADFALQFVEWKSKCLMCCAEAVESATADLADDDWVRDWSFVRQLVLVDSKNCCISCSQLRELLGLTSSVPLVEFGAYVALRRLPPVGHVIRDVCAQLREANKTVDNVRDICFSSGVRLRNINHRFYSNWFDFLACCFRDIMVGGACITAFGVREGGIAVWYDNVRDPDAYRTRCLLAAATVRHQSGGTRFDMSDVQFVPSTTNERAEQEQRSKVRDLLPAAPSCCFAHSNGRATIAGCFDNGEGNRYAVTVGHGFVSVKDLRQLCKLSQVWKVINSDAEPAETVLQVGIYNKDLLLPSVALIDGGFKKKAQVLSRTEICLSVDDEHLCMSDVEIMRGSLQCDTGVCWQGKNEPCYVFRTSTVSDFAVFSIPLETRHHFDPFTYLVSDSAGTGVRWPSSAFFNGNSLLVTLEELIINMSVTIECEMIGASSACARGRLGYDSTDGFFMKLKHCGKGQCFSPQPGDSGSAWIITSVTSPRPLSEGCVPLANLTGVIVGIHTGLKPKCTPPRATFQSVYDIMQSMGMS
jgi:hypothetical protein